MLKAWRRRANAMVLKRQFHQRVYALEDAADLGIPLTQKEKSPLCFIGGCGRSGTTVLGDILGLHPRVQYLMEPRERWLCLDSRTDLWGYFGAPMAFSVRMDAHMVRPAQAARLNWHFRRAEAGQTVVEKTPENVFRVFWLKALAPDARFIFISRHPYAVIRSIVEAAQETVPYGILDMNNWYGRRECKKQLLKNAALGMGMDPGIPDGCRTTEDWAALEWVLSKGAQNLAREELPGEQAFELTYETLLAQPEVMYRSLLDFLELEPLPEVIEAACATLRPPGPLPAEPILSSPLKELISGELSSIV